MPYRHSPKTNYQDMAREVVTLLHESGLSRDQVVGVIACIEEMLDRKSGFGWMGLQHIISEVYGYRYEE